ncbi:MAG: SGNH/GDSL hydrolase family protein [Bacteroidia bacterium]
MRIFLFLLGSLLLACQGTADTQSTEAISSVSQQSTPQVQSSSSVPKVIVWGGNLTIHRKEIEFRFQDLLANSLASNGYEREVIDWGRKDLLLGVPDERLGFMLDSIVNQKPEWVVLAFGTDEVWREDIAVSSFAERLKIILSSLQKAEIKTLLITPNPPSPEAPKVIWARGEEISRQVREIAIEYFSTVVDYWNFCEIYATQAGNSPEDLLLDERYPNEAAHQFITQEATALLSFKIGTE